MSWCAAVANTDDDYSGVQTSITLARFEDNETAEEWAALEHVEYVINNRSGDADALLSVKIMLEEPDCDERARLCGLSPITLLDVAVCLKEHLRGEYVPEPVIAKVQQLPVMTKEAVRARRKHLYSLVKDEDDTSLRSEHEYDSLDAADDNEE